MELVFLSNYYNHHQAPCCEAWHRLTGGKLTFVATQPLSEERKQLGWGTELPPPFLHTLTEENREEWTGKIQDADVVLLGDAPLDLVQSRPVAGKRTFQYSERLYKHGCKRWKLPIQRLKYRKRYGKAKSMYLLSAGAYAAGDYHRLGVYRGKSYRWGYFPPVADYDLPRLMEGKQTAHLLWCGRLLDWKHPEQAVEVARRLRAEGRDFRLDIIGTGPMEAELAAMIAKENLSDAVHLLGAMAPEQVRAHMEQAGIYLFTSGFGEGWGAVVNEAMNSGCALVASHAAGAVPCLVEHGKNGLIYESGQVDGLYRKVCWLLDHPMEQRRLGEQAYRTIVELWNAEVAAKRLLELARSVETTGKCDLFSEGPCSPTVDLPNNWFKEKGDADLQGLAVCTDWKS